MEPYVRELLKKTEAPIFMAETDRSSEVKTFGKRNEEQSNTTTQYQHNTQLITTKTGVKRNDWI